MLRLKRVNKLNNYSVGFVFSKIHSEEWVTLIQKARPESQRGRLNGIGGHIEKGESPHECMSRECIEECGLIIPESDWTNVCNLRAPDYNLHVFYTRIPELVELKSLQDEPVKWYLAKSLPFNVLDNLRWLVPMCLDVTIIKPLEIQVTK